MTNSAERMPPALNWYKWDPQAFAASNRVQMMTGLQELAHRRMLDYFWVNGPLPQNDEELEVICRGLVGITDIRRVLQLSWNETPLGWVNETLQELREETLDLHARKSRGGKKAAETRAKARAYRERKSITAQGSKSVARVLEESTKTPGRVLEDSTKSLPTEVEVEDITTTTLEGAKKRHEPGSDVILVRNGLKWGEIQHPAKRGYRKIPREYFQDVMFATGDDRDFPKNLVIETQEELDAWLEV